MRVYLCLTQQHDLRLVVLAALICIFATYTALSVIRRAQLTTGRARLTWLATAGTAAGGGIWATHFVAMLSYQPGMPIGYDVGLTILSIVVAIVITALGFAVAIDAERPIRYWLGGGLAGSGISAMHYTGMAAIRVPALVGYDPFLVVLSLIFGITLGALALRTALPRDTLRWRSLGTLLLTLGICAMHFTAMGALELTPSPLVPLPDAVLSPAMLAFAVAGVAVLLLGISLTGSIVDQHLANRSVQETVRLQQLVNATFEGIAIHADGRLLDGNHALADLAGYPLEQMIGRDVLSFVPVEDRADVEGRIADGVEGAYETRLQRPDGGQVAVEILARSIDYKGQRARVAAIRDITERKAAEAQILFMANHDVLTGLPNRVLFRDRLEQALARARRDGDAVAVLCLDLDRFKEVNDMRGHAAGDALLEQAAARLSAAVRETDTVARLGGDEFAIVQTGGPQPQHAAGFADRLVATVAEPFEFEGEGMAVGLSVGIALFPNDGGDVDTLLKNADTALYRAKADGRGVYRMFEPEMDAKLQVRRVLEYDLRQALAQQQLEVHYQPQAEISSRKITGFEALVRWQHPRRGMVAPDEFIPLAEETGLIVPLGEWVLHTACAAAATWPEHLRVGVNLSPVQFTRCDLPALIENVLRTHHLAPERLELEITESVLIKDVEQALTTLRQLKALGVRIAMDDFGTGYSSLSYLQRFPFDKIKIDRSFIEAMQDTTEAVAIVRAVTGLGQGLKIPVIAEGVETVEQMDLLRRENCDEIQGYLIGEPLALGDGADILAAVATAQAMLDAAAAPAASARLVLAQAG